MAVEPMPSIGHTDARSNDEMSTHVRVPTTRARALGGLAVGAVAIGALAIGALAIGRLVIGRARVRRLEIDELVVGRLYVTDPVKTPSTPQAENDKAP